MRRLEMSTRDTLECQRLRRTGTRVRSLSMATSKKLQKYLRQVGRNIKSVRVKQGLRQTDIVEMLGMNYRHYQDIEAGKINVRIGTLIELAQIYKVNLQELICFD
jgi:ribosome-binding protein aMBF1 (putative translation factor)